MQVPSRPGAFPSAGLLLGLIVLSGCLTGAAPHRSYPSYRSYGVQPAQTGVWTLRGRNYTATVGANGMLIGIDLGGQNLLASPVTYGPGDSGRNPPQGWRVLASTRPDPDTVVFDLVVSD